MVLDRRNLSLEYATDCLIVRGGDDSPRSFPLTQLDQLICMHNVHLTTQLMGQLLKRGIDFVVVNQRHVDHGFSMFADHQKHAQRRCLQYEWQQQLEKRFDLAVSIIIHKLNISQRICRRLKVQKAMIEPFHRAIDSLTSLSDEQALRGVEGSAQRQMFMIWRDMLPTKIGFAKRLRRPPPDPVNAVLSLSYTMVYHESVRQLKICGLDPQLGFYHRLTSGRDSLACDIMEPLRPQIEHWVVAMFSEHVLNLRHFSKKNGACLMGKEGRARFYELYAEQLPQFQRPLKTQARWLSRKLDGDVNA